MQKIQVFPTFICPRLGFLLTYFLSSAGCVIVVTRSDWENNLVTMFKLHFHQKDSMSLCWSENDEGKKE